MLSRHATVAKDAPPHLRGLGLDAAALPWMELPVRALWDTMCVTVYVSHAFINVMSRVTLAAVVCLTSR